MSTSVNFEEAGNYAEAESTTETIKTLEQLLEAAKVDLETWQVKDWGVKKWEVGAKYRESDLKFEEGKITGWLKDKGIYIAPLWSVWAKFIRRNPEPIAPTIRPVECKATFAAQPLLGRTKGKALVFCDPQFGFLRDITTAKLEPFHDRAALDVISQVARFIRPERIDVLGDLLDFSMWSDKFLQLPEFEQTTQPAICEAHWWLRQLRKACPKAAITLHEGNHELRMKTAIITHLRAAYGLKPADELDLPPAMSPQRLLSLHKLGIEWFGDYPADEDWINESLCLSHGDTIRRGSGNTTGEAIKTADVSMVFGHVHRKEMASRTIHVRGGRRTITAYSPGCTCRIDGVVPGDKMPNWQQGFAIVDYDDGGHSFGDVEIVDGRALWAGRRFIARNRLDDIRQDLPDWNW